MKEYKTFEELVKEATARKSFDADLESILHYQDLIGHSTYEDLQELANGDYKEMFYTLFALAEGATAAIKFYAQYSNYCTNLRYDREETAAMLEEKQAAYEKIQVEKNEANEKLAAALLETNKVEKELKAEKERTEAQATEIQALKAKLYDLITANQ